MPPANSPFEAAVLAQMAVMHTTLIVVQDDVKEVKGELSSYNQKADKQGEKIHEIQLEMAKRQKICPVIAKTERQLLERIKPLESSVATLKRGVAMVKGGYWTVVFIASSVSGAALLVYHLLNISKVLASHQ